MHVEEFIVLKEEVGCRIDLLICKRFKLNSRNFFHKLILKGFVFVNNKPIKKQYKAKLNDYVKIIFPEAEKFKVEKENIKIDIVYEDDEILVINKKRGMVVHPAPGNYSRTLVNALMWHCENKLSSIGGVLRPGIVHRIDKNTTGLLAIAKTNEAFLNLVEQIKNHAVNRIYVAIVHGKFKEKEGLINLPIGRSFKDRKKMAVNFKNGKSAITHFKVLEEYFNFSYIKLKLETGRTHQIRVHMSYLKHPVAGDDLYGFKSDFKKYNLKFGQCLHAKELEFFHNKLNKKINFSVEPDEYFLDFLNRCQKEYLN